MGIIGEQNLFKCLNSKTCQTVISVHQYPEEQCQNGSNHLTCELYVGSDIDTLANTNRMTLFIFEAHRCFWLHCLRDALNLTYITRL